MSGEIKTADFNKPNINANPTRFVQTTQSNNNIFNNGRPYAVVVDDFADNTVSIYPKESAVLSHGDVVSSFITKECPNAMIERRGSQQPKTINEKAEIYNYMDNIIKNGTPEEKKLFLEDALATTKSIKEINRKNLHIDKYLQNIATEIKKGKKIDGVNLSRENSVGIKDLAEVTGLPLTRGNLSEYKEQVRNWIKNNKSNAFIKLNNEITAIEEITSTGVPVYVAAGNSGEDGVNLYSFANGSTTVGSKEKYMGGMFSAASEESSNNSLVKRFEQGGYQVRQIRDNFGQIGYDINEDDKIDIYEKDLPPNFVKNHEGKENKIIHGTSYAAPTALGKDLKNKYNESCGL